MMFNSKAFDALLKMADVAITTAKMDAQRSKFPLNESALYREAIVYLHGLEQKIPPGWERFKEQAKKEDDPEWPLYQKLKAKFA